MTAAHRLPFAVLAAALAVLGAGCGNKCKNETPKICDSSLPTCSNMAAGQTVTVSFHATPACNQAAPQCVVIMDNVSAGSGTIQFDAQAEACESSNSCPPPTCAIERLDCRFTAPPPGTYGLVVFDANGTPSQGTFVSASNGQQTSCSTL